MGNLIISLSWKINSSYHENIMQAKEILEGTKKGKWRRKLLFNRIFRASIVKSLTAIPFQPRRKKIRPFSVWKFHFHGDPPIESISHPFLTLKDNYLIS
jgi:hypothetical protein